MFIFCRKIAGRLGGSESLTFYQQPLKQNFNFCYINCLKNYMVNRVDYLLQNKKTEMFVNNEIYVIHPENQFCNLPNGTDSSEVQTKSNILEFINSTYPKQKYLSLIFNPLVQRNMINDELYFIPYPDIHIADFCVFLNNKFGKVETTNNKLIKFCKYLQSLKFKFPKVSVKNPVAQKYLC